MALRDELNRGKVAPVRVLASPTELLGRCLSLWVGKRRQRAAGEGGDMEKMAEIAIVPEMSPIAVPEQVQLRGYLNFMESRDKGV